MSKSNQNSLLLLTTLGVYIGLLMAGSAPGVVAQQAGAMTRNFDVKDEIEVKDDLDNKPDDCGQLREQTRGFLENYHWFSDRSFYDFRDLVETFNESFPEKAHPFLEFSLTVLDSERPFTNSFLYGSSPSDPELRKTLISEFLIAANGLPGRHSKFAVSRTSAGTDYILESSSLPYDTPLVRYLYSNAFRSVRCYDLFESDELYFRNAQCTVQNDNLVISTRLARGSLDALLAKDAK